MERLGMVLRESLQLIKGAIKVCSLDKGPVAGLA